MRTLFVRFSLMSVGLLLAVAVSPALAQETTDASQVYETATEFRRIHERLGGSESLGEAISRPYYLGDTLVQYFDRARLERAGRSSSEPLGSDASIRSRPISRAIDRRVDTPTIPTRATRAQWAVFPRD